jgi:tRNA-splicing ligase RtcB (3'-phosphate/5'-hydroxy nucleic acid ligase)
VERHQLRQVAPFTYEIARSDWAEMRVPARLFASGALLAAARRDHSLDQLANVATLPGVVRAALAMPDIHEGYGFPIGGVAAMRIGGGVISPGGVGYDINCGVRLLASELLADDVRPNLHRLADALFALLPTGVGVGGRLHVNKPDMESILASGSEWALAEGYASAEDLAHTESGGRLPGADPAKVSPAARQRGQDQVGTLGSGNHFAEIDVVRQVFDEQIAGCFGLRTGQLVMQIHCGSRGLGHQVATDTIRDFQSVSRRYGYQLVDRQLVCAPITSPEGESYLAAMSCAANYAWVNRQVLTFRAREAFQQALQGTGLAASLRVVYDVGHNLAQMEDHLVDGRTSRVCVHRKGATRAFGPGRPEVPLDYRAVGQPVLVPGSMGTESYVLAGTTKAMDLSFGSCCHGAGRALSRSAARQQVRGDALRRSLEENGILVRSGSMGGLAEEAPQAYKDVSAVVDVVTQVGLGKPVARLEPLVVIKG